MLDIQDLNHDIQELPNGNWMAIAYKVQLITTTQVQLLLRWRGGWDGVTGP